jgi:hypothetical protein
MNAKTKKVVPPQHSLEKIMGPFAIFNILCKNVWSTPFAIEQNRHVLKFFHLKFII